MELPRARTRDFKACDGNSYEDADMSEQEQITELKLPSRTHTWSFGQLTPPRWRKCLVRSSGICDSSTHGETSANTTRPFGPI